MPKLSSSLVSILLAVCLAAGSQSPRPRSDTNRRKSPAPLVFLDSTREIDGLKGPVRRIETEVVRVEVRGGEVVPKERALLERTLYDELGRRVANETYPVSGSQVGEETHTYDAQGNLSETVVRDARGAVLSRLSYSYEFDQFGNWVKMTASVAVLSGGQLGSEPTEIVERTIVYYASEAPAATPTGVAAGAAVGTGAAATSDAAAPPPMPEDDGEVLDVGLLNERTADLPQPAYPVGWRRLAEPVTVTVAVRIDTTGRVEAARARGGSPALREAAEKAARRAVFSPFSADGRPVKARGEINYTFNFLP